MTRRPSGWTCRRSIGAAVAARDGDPVRIGRRRMYPAIDSAAPSAQTARAWWTTSRARRETCTPSATGAGRESGCAASAPAREIDQAFFLGQPRRIGGARVVLRHLSSPRPPRGHRRRARAGRHRCTARSRSTDVAGFVRHRSASSTRASIGPASSALTTRMIVTPVSRLAVRSRRDEPARRRGTSAAARRAR